MKKIIAIGALLLCMVCATETKAQAVASWPTGTMSVASVTATTKVPSYSITPTNTAYHINITVDTSLVINFTNVKVKAGALVYVKVINGATAATRTITGNTKCTMQSFTMTSAKSHMLTFVYDGTNFINTSKFLIN